MQKSFMDLLACPSCHKELTAIDIELDANDRIKSGCLACISCNLEFPIINYIPRFVAAENYSQNFGYQWNFYRETQYDSELGLPMSESRFYETTAWPDNLKGELILEAGCGAGRFTETALAAGATLVSFDYSNAVEANYKMNGNYPNILIVQADIFCPPFKYAIFDRLFCMGVIQHTPNPKLAFKSLPRFVKNNGKIAIDVYLKKNLLSWFVTYRRVRWLTRHMDVRTVHALSKAYVNMTWPIIKWLWGFGRGGRRIARYVFLAKDRFWRKGLEVTDEQQKESLVLHFIDQLCAYHDKPQSVNSVMSWLNEENIKDVEVFKGGNGVIGRGKI